MATQHSEEDVTASHHGICPNSKPNSQQEVASDKAINC